MNHKSELRDRIEARKKDIQSKVAALKADTKGAWRENIERLEKERASVEELIKDGWENVTEAVAKKLNDWLKRNKDI